MPPVRIKLYDAVLSPFLTEVSARSAHAAAIALRDRARRHAPRKTGAGAASIDVTMETTSSKGTYYRIGPSKQYMVYQDSGTGAIRARPGRFLRFSSGGTFIFRRKTRGVPATRFMEKALAETVPEDFKPGM